jgi:thymidylate kinase
MRAHEIVDRALGERAVVVGSLPPGGRDLDVLVRGEEDTARVERALRDAGFAALGDSWLRFAHMTAELVELIPAPSYDLGAEAERALFGDAIALDGCTRLARPAPAHAVLLLARQAAESAELAPKRRRRLEDALAEDPAAWQRAVEHSDGWGGREVLDALDRLRSEPAREAEHAAGHLLPAGVRARLGAARDRARGRRRGAVIALSGLDGAGKSTQAEALSDALERLGYDVAIEWTRIGFNERFWEVAVRLKGGLEKVLMATGRLRECTGAANVPAADPVKAIRQASGPLTDVWATAIALENVYSQWRLTSGFLARGYVVICDRYTLDSIVSLRYLIDEQRRFRFQRAMLRALMRRPAAAFLLEVTPETAWERKGEHGLQWLRRHHALYQAEHAALGVVRLDGERSPDELAARIAREAWEALAPGVSSGAR